MAARRLSTPAIKERQVQPRKAFVWCLWLGLGARGQRAKSRVTDLLVCLGLVAVTWAVLVKRWLTISSILMITFTSMKIRSS